MKILFYLSSKATWDRAHIRVLADEHVRAGYRVRVLERAWWAVLFFAFQRRGMIHLFGVQSGFVAAVIRFLHPSSRIVLHADDIGESPSGFVAALSRALALRLAHTRVVSRQDLLRHEAFAGRDVMYIPYAIGTVPQVMDITLLRAHGLELQNYFLTYVNPRHWNDLQQTIAQWRAHVRPGMRDVTLAIVFTEDMPASHIAFGHDVVVLGAVPPYVERMLCAGARAVFVPTLFSYRYELMTAMASGKYAIPLRELVNRNPFALEELAGLYGEEDHALSDLQDAALTMSWGHVARAIIDTDHNPQDIALVYENLYEQLLFADAVTANARLS